MQELEFSNDLQL